MGLGKVGNLSRAATRSRRSATLTIGVGLSAVIVGLAVPLMASAHSPAPALPLTSPLTGTGETPDCTESDPLVNTLGLPSALIGGSNNQAHDGENEGPAVWANATGYPDITTLDFSSSESIIEGALVSRSHLKIGGSKNQYRHGTEYGAANVSGKPAFDLSGSDNCFSGDPEIAQVSRPTPGQPQGFPFDFDTDDDGDFLEHYAPGTPSALAAMADPAAGAQYHVCGVSDPDGAGTAADTAIGCSGGNMVVGTGTVVPAGLYYVTGQVNLSAQALTATVTIVSGGNLFVNGSSQSEFFPYTQSLLFLGNFGQPNSTTGEDAVKVEGSISLFQGVVHAPNGRLTLSGSQLSFTCIVMGDRVRVAGQLIYVDGDVCPPPDIPDGPDLDVEKTPDNPGDTGGTIAAGAQGVFTIKVRNSGDTAATNVTLDDALPNDGGLTWTLTSATKNPGGTNVAANCTTPLPGGNTLDCNFGNLGVGEEIVVVVTSSATSAAAQCAPNGDGLLDNGVSTGGPAVADADNDDQETDAGRITITCPPQNGTITIVKDTVPNNGQNFTFTDNIPNCTVGPLDDDSNNTLSNQVVCSNVAPGSYSVSENDPSGLGYTLTNLVCTDANSTENIGTRTASIALDSGESLTCTFTNTENGDITIVKDAVPNSATDFSFTDDIPGCTVGPLDDDSNNTLDNDTECTNVAPGNYTVTENDPTSSGWALTNLVCSDANSGESVGTRTASIVLDPGEDLTCTFTNTQPPGSITIVKDAVPDSGTDFSFTDNIPSPCTIGTLDDDGAGSTPNQRVCSNVAPGAYTVSENNPPSGWVLTNLVCTDANSTENIGTRTATINLEAGENVTCTFTNTQNGSITIVKDAIPNGPTDFPFSDTIPGCTIDTLDDDSVGPLSNQDTCSNVAPGQYTVTESDPAGSGFALTNLVCSDANSDENVGTRTATINLDPGETVICTFTNTQNGTVTIVKDAVPNGPTDFTFSDDIPAPCVVGQLDDDADGALSSQVACSNVPAGSYTVTESDPTAAGFALTNLVCSDADSTEDIPNRTAGINLAPGETLTCTFTNTQLPGTITIVKDAVPNGPTDFAFTDDIPAPCVVGLLDDDADGTLSNQVVCSNVPAGAYTVAENDPAPGFALTGLQCTGDANGSTSLGTRSASINLDPGENVTCTFTNTQNGTVTIVKDAVPNGPTDFSFTDDIPGPCVVGPLDDDADGALSNQVVCANVAPGSYTVTENDPGPGFTLTGLVCSDDDSTENVGGRTAGIDLDPGESLTCTFTNTQAGSVTIVKDAVPNGPTDFTFTDDIPGQCVVGPLDNDADGTLSNQVVCANVAPGSYTVAENDPGPGFALTALECSDADSTEDVPNRTAGIDLEPGESVTCTFTNTQAASITIVKNAVPDGPTDFTFTDDIPAPCVVGPLDDDADGTLSNQVLCSNVTPGQYTVSESDPGSGFDVTGIACAGDDNGSTSLANRSAAIDLDPGENVSCTFTNTQKGTLFIDKVTVPSGETQSFGFTGTDLPGTADDTFSLTDAATPKSVSVAPGTYHVSEDADPAGWKLTDINCVDASQDSTDAGREATAVIAPGETVTCTFTNTKQPTLTVIKTVVNDNGGTAVAGDFAIQVTGNSPDPAAFDGAASPGTSVEIGPGSYIVTETEDPDYVASYSAGCSGELDPGESATCTVTNDDKAPKLTLVKVVVNDDGGTALPSAWTLTASGPSGFNGSGPSVSSGASFDQGTYDLSETGPTGYTASDWDCESQRQTDGDTVNVGLGDDITCTITNDDSEATLIVYKQVVNDNGGTATAGQWTMTVSAPAGLSFPGEESGTSNGVDAGSYTVGETGGPGAYDGPSYPTAGLPQGVQQNDCNAQGQVTLANGETKRCVLRNDDQAPKLTLVKAVVNDNGGDADPSDWTLTATGPDGFSGPGPSVASGASFDQGTYTLSESGPDGYTAGDWECTGESQEGNTVDVDLGDDITCTITNDDTPPKLTLVKVVVNDDGGTAQPSAWTLTASGPSGFNGPGPSVSSGASFDQGTYDLSESGPAAYDASDWDCGGEGESQNQVDGDTVEVGLGDDITCTITNDDEPATLIVIKNVVNDNGGTLDAGDFQMTINGVTADGGNSFAGEAAPGTSKTLSSVGAYTVTEAAVAGYTQTAASADCAGTIALGATKTCTITNNDNPPTITGLGAIDVQKSADPTSVKEPGGPVDFTVTITNTSTVNVTITNVVDSVFGDLDDDGGSGVFDVPINLVPGEKVSKTFQRQVSGAGGQAHTNVVTASGVDQGGNPVSDSDDARVEITPRLIDLVIVKTATSPTPLNGIVNYTMTVTNKGPDTATNVQLADPAPSGITYLTAGPSKGTCNLTASLITCSLGSLAAGETVTINVTARATAVGTHTNVATVTGGGGRETNPADNVDDAVTIVPAPFVPPTRPKPEAEEPVCLTLTVSPKMIKADGKPDRVSVKVTAGKKRVKGTKVTIFGAGVRKTGRSNAKGMAYLRINPKRAGLITITALETNQRVCGPKRIGVVGVFLPPLTG